VSKDEQQGQLMTPEANHERSASVRRLFLLQGAYYLVSGVWPLLHMRSFEAITGPKAEGWLVKTVGVLVSVIGAVLLLGRRRDPRAELSLLACGSAAGLAAVEAVYAAKRRISIVYLLDALLKVGLVASFAQAWIRSSGQDS
jgi:hypothetical protein